MVFNENWEQNQTGCLLGVINVKRLQSAIDV